MKDDVISRQAAINTAQVMYERCEEDIEGYRDLMVESLKVLPSAQPEIIRCKDCKNQEKFFQKDGRRKDGGYYIYGCSLAEGYSHVCLDDDYCSRAERRTDDEG